MDESEAGLQVVKPNPIPLTKNDSVWTILAHIDRSQREDVCALVLWSMAIVLLFPQLEALDCKLVVFLRVSKFLIGLLFNLSLGSKRNVRKAECHECDDETGRQRKEGTDSYQEKILQEYNLKFALPTKKNF